MTASNFEPVASNTSRLLEDGTVFPPVTPDPPPPPGYQSPLDGSPRLDRLDAPDHISPRPESSG